MRDLRTCAVEISDVEKFARFQVFRNFNWTARSCYVYLPDVDFMSSSSLDLVDCGRFCVKPAVPVLEDDFVDLAGLNRVGLSSAACSMGCWGGLAI